MVGGLDRSKFLVKVSKSVLTLFRLLLFINYLLFVCFYQLLIISILYITVHV